MFTIHDVVEPDLGFVTGDQTDILTEANIQGAPEGALRSRISSSFNFVTQTDFTHAYRSLLQTAQY